MTIAAYRYKYADWQARVMAFKPEWHYTGHNCKGDLPEDAIIEPMYTQAYVRELEKQCADYQRRWESERKATEASIVGGRYPDGLPAC
jgi:hypothetical protein